jgi:nuclease S1
VTLFRRTLLLAVAFLAQNFATAMAWDAPGHELIVTMACARLNPKARQAVDELAREMIGPSGQPYDAITLSCWMDDLRKNSQMPGHGQFLSWHYIDIPFDDRDPMPSFVPGQDNDVHGNVVQALKRAVVVLKGGTDPYITSRAMACAMVMHLVGDIHQPLHCATKYFLTHGELHQDNGGNKEDVSNGPPGEMKFNLHAFWDSAYRASFDTASGNVTLDADSSASQRELAGLLRNGNVMSSLLDVNFDQWARDSNAIARDFVYRDITATDNRKYCRLSSGYVVKARRIACEQMSLAALRLAKLLNDTLGADQPSPPPSSFPAGPPSIPY